MGGTNGSNGWDNLCRSTMMIQSLLVAKIAQHIITAIKERFKLFPFCAVSHASLLDFLCVHPLAPLTWGNLSVNIHTNTGCIILGRSFERCRNSLSVRSYSLSSVGIPAMRREVLEAHTLAVQMRRGLQVLETVLMSN